MSGLQTSSVPINDIMLVLMGNLPLKEDLEEYKMVFKAFTVLYAAGKFKHKMVYQRFLPMVGLTFFFKC